MAAFGEVDIENPTFDEIDYDDNTICVTEEENQFQNMMIENMSY